MSFREPITREQARLIALGAQGFTDPLPKGAPDMRALRRVFKRVGVVQIDSVNVLARAHQLPFFSRLGPYRRDLLGEKAFEKRELCEYWAHMASYVPMKHYPLLRWRMEEFYEKYVRPRSTRTDLFRRITSEISERGEQSISTLSDRGERAGAWWGWSEGKMALELLFSAGRLAVSRRGPNFERYYDLPERVIPAELLKTSPPDPDASRKELLKLASRCLGIATAKDLADYFRLPLAGSRSLIAELVEAGDLRPADVEGWKDPAYLPRRFVLPSEASRDTFVSPFDSLIWFRERTERLFHFYYRIEIYVPAGKRIHGYYVLPFLMGDRLAARVDLKADRKVSSLLVKSAFLEPPHKSAQVASRLASSLKEMAEWLELERIVVEARGDVALTRGLTREIRSHQSNRRAARVAKEIG